MKKRKTSGPPNDPSDFARRLVSARIAKGWSQSELARRASVHLGKTFGRDNISKYEKDATAPTPLRLNALSKALGVRPEELTADGRLLSVEMEHAPDISMRTTRAGKAWLRINQEVPLRTALAILDLLKEPPNATAP